MNFKTLAYCLIGILAYSHTGILQAYEEVPPQELMKRQARSVHLNYYVPGEEKPITSAMGTVTVTESQPWSYYSILAWQQGYCGIQDWGEEKVFIFSVWDPGNPMDFKAKPGDVPVDRQAKVLFHHDGVDISRFGGEGTGAKALTSIGWKEGDPVTAKIEVTKDGEDRIAFTCSIKVGDFDWTKLATISTLKNPQMEWGLGYLYSFVEDFGRNYESAKVARRAEFSNVCVNEKKGTWTRLNNAMFTGDSTPSENVDAGAVREGAFFLKTGGATKNEHTPLWKWI